MMTAICKVPGTYLVRDSRKPLPIGKTEADVSTVVQEYDFGWECKGCGPNKGSTTPSCIHIKAAMNAKDASE
jgi:hypothetical protein